MKTSKPIHDVPCYLLNEHYGDRYFDAYDALEEAKRIHIGNGRVVERVSGVPFIGGKRAFRIGETGFGAGRLLVALMSSLDAGGVRGAVIDYHTVELHPMAAERIGQILHGFRDRAGHYIDKLIEAYSRIGAATPGLHSAAIAGDFGVINLRLYIGEALSMVDSLASPCNAWFLDGHAPKKNPDIWRAELLLAIGQKTEQNGTVTTFTAAGHVRRALEAAGFVVEKVPGCGGKKEAVLGQRAAFSAQRTAHLS